MDDKNEPITDKENFPPKTEQIPVLDLPTIAYYDGRADGYRLAVRDFIVWAIVFFVVSLLLRRFDN